MLRRLGTDRDRWLDEFMQHGVSRRLKAIAEGKFPDEIVSDGSKTEKADRCISVEMRVPDQITAESISKLRPAFKEGGVVTAGNASGINDAAAAPQSL